MLQVTPNFNGGKTLAHASSDSQFQKKHWGMLQVAPKFNIEKHWHMLTLKIKKRSSIPRIIAFCKSTPMTQIIANDTIERNKNLLDRTTNYTTNTRFVHPNMTRHSCKSIITTKKMYKISFTVSNAKSNYELLDLKAKNIEVLWA